MKQFIEVNECNIFNVSRFCVFFKKNLPTDWETLFSVRVFYFYGRYWCVQPHSTGTRYTVSFVNNFPSRLHCTTSRLTKMKNHRKDYSYYYSGCIAGDGDLFETLRPPGFDKRIGGAFLSRALVPTFCTMANSLRLWWLVCKLLTGCSDRDGIKFNLHFSSSSRISKVTIFGWLYLIVYADVQKEMSIYKFWKKSGWNRILEIRNRRIFNYSRIIFRLQCLVTFFFIFYFTFFEDKKEL